MTFLEVRMRISERVSEGLCVCVCECVSGCVTLSVAGGVSVCLCVCLCCYDKSAMSQHEGGVPAGPDWGSQVRAGWLAAHSRTGDPEAWDGPGRLPRSAKPQAGKLQTERVQKLSHLPANSVSFFNP